MLGSVETDLTAKFGANCATLKDSAMEYLFKLHEEYCMVAIPPPPNTCCVDCVKICLSGLGTVGSSASSAEILCP